MNPLQQLNLKQKEQYDYEELFQKVQEQETLIGQMKAQLQETKFLKIKIRQLEVQLEKIHSRQISASKSQKNLRSLKSSQNLSSKPNLQQTQLLQQYKQTMVEAECKLKLQEICQLLCTSQQLVTEKIQTQLKEIQHYKKFEGAMIAMFTEFTPDTPPLTLKQAWKQLKHYLSKYMQVKKEKEKQSVQICKIKWSLQNFYEKVKQHKLWKGEDILEFIEGLQIGVNNLIQNQQMQSEEMQAGKLKTEKTATFPNNNQNNHYVKCV